jgi:NADH:ubiquinone oxidoreductase subunit E
MNVCTATACHSAGSDLIRAALVEEVKARGAETGRGAIYAARTASASLR